MKTLVIQEVNRKTTIEYKTNSTNYSEVNDRITKIQGQALGSEVNIVVESSVNSLSFISKTLVVDSTGVTSTAIVQNISSKTFLSGVVYLENNITQIGGDPENLNSDFVAEESILANRVVAISPSGKIVHASSLDVTHANKVIGISITSGAANSTISVRRSGRLVNTGWSWNSGDLLFLGVDGELTTNSNSGALLVNLGFAINSTEILINISRSVIRG